MTGIVYDQDGHPIATEKDGDLFDRQGMQVGTVRKDNVYDRNGKFIFHLKPIGDADAAGSMTAEAIGRLFHPKRLERDGDPRL